jgi:hypothetical protein
MPQYAISTITGVSPKGTLSPDEFVGHLGASPWQPATSQAIDEPWEGWERVTQTRYAWVLAFTAHVGTMPVHGRLGSVSNHLVLDGSIEAVSHLAVWYRGLIEPAYRLSLHDELTMRDRWSLELTPETTVAEIRQALTERLQLARSSAKAAATRRQRVVQRQQERLAVILNGHDVSSASLTALHDTGSEVIYGLTVA